MADVAQATPTTTPPPPAPPQGGDAIDEFMGLSNDQQMSTLQQLAPDKQDALLAQVKTRRLSQQQAPATPAAPQQNVLQRVWNEPGGLGEFATGVRNAAAQTGATAMHVLQSPVLGLGLQELPTWQRSMQQAEQEANAPSASTAESMGKLAENVVEFAAGDEALKGMSFMGKMDALRPLADAMKKSPVIAKIVGNSLRGAAVTGGQVLAHGGTPGQAGTAALEAGGTGVALESVLQPLASAVESARPGTATLAGAEFPTTPGSVESGTPVLQRIAPRGSMTDVATQRADEAMGNIAKQAVSNTGDLEDALPPDDEPQLLSRGSGPMSVNRARKQVGLYNNILDKMTLGPRKTADLIADRDDLLDQISRREAWATQQTRYPAFDALDAVRNTGSFEDAANMVTPHYEAALENARNPAEEAVAQKGVENGQFLQRLHNFIEPKFGGVSPQEAELTQGQLGQLQRSFEPPEEWNQRVEDFLNEGNNREIAQRTIGTQGVMHIKQLGSAFENAAQFQQARGLASNIGAAIWRHYQGIAGYMGRGAGWATIPFELGLATTHHLGMSAEIAGVPAMTGTVAGIRNYVSDKLATDPEFLRAFTYAVKSGLPNRTATPLLAARLISQIRQRQGGQ